MEKCANRLSRRSQRNRDLYWQNVCEFVSVSAILAGSFKAFAIIKSPVLFSISFSSWMKSTIRENHAADFFCFLK
ncbi:hypothetical protein [Salegentibacter maritimus]|uniref:hypothetical protein n=1 Tax=Salegentibacter maritimus TaxID=2794347 RepID=UPI0018E471A0|nr:hypothetical protein [Salegentibacter maritimus]MBI6115834.1 hypothetical protein [Salegentibacter maritimus]